ncbi:MAG: F(420)H(2) dehydrogenase subunit N [Methanomassiliicoccales archaeon PtaU1.Bin124]|nr:MAG: F(420)H(2) dehydrogenase subunit N [Methanomassiliicoccales archaeon PtaU1.Bin124]
MVEFTAIVPEIILVLFAMALPALGYATKNSKILAGFGLAGVVLSAVFTFMMANDLSVAYEFGNGLIRVDQFAILFMFIFLAVAGYVILASAVYVKDDKHQPEFFSLIMLATVGMMIVASSTDLFALFLGIELTSLASYVLVGFRKKDVKGAEAATKYFIIGGLSSGFSLFGISLVYGITHTTSFAGINTYLSWSVPLANPELLWLAMIMVVVGFGFKISMVPFHMWAPDVYEGAPTTITAMLAAGSKKMGFVAMFKFFLIGLIAIKADWQLLVGIMAIVTMTWGNIVAIQQTNIKRMLAYSSIAQAGYILMAIPVATEYALAGGLFQILTHAFMKGGAFLIVATLATVAIGETIKDYKGLAKRSPFMAFAMMIFLLSLAGIPPLAGFWSKFVLFSAPIDAAATAGAEWMTWLALAAIINSAISLFYYVRVIKYMYVDEGECKDKLKLPWSMVAAVAICLVAVIGIGLWPDPFIEYLKQAAHSFFVLY